MEPIELKNFETLLAGVAERCVWRGETSLDVYLPVDQLLKTVETVMASGWLYLSAMTGVDLPPAAGSEAEGQVEILYHFCEKACILTLRVRLPYSHPVAPSICALIPPATLYEREIIEMLGVTLEGTPSTARLLLPDDWPDGVYPLRKSFKGL
jgi:Ni,Fe-hydrogenase III component G